MEKQVFTRNYNNDNKYIYLDPVGCQQPQYCLIFLHGLGDTADGFVDVFDSTDCFGDTLKECRIVLPTAPKMQVTRSDGYVMNSWYDINKTDKKD